MPMRRMGALLSLVATLWMAGCAVPVQKPVDLPSDYLSTGKGKAGRIGVVMSVLPKPDTQFPGAGCLLCVAVANAAHSSLTKQVQGFSTDELKPLPGDLAKLLQQRGLDAVLIAEPLNIAALPDLKPEEGSNRARKDFSALKAQHGIDRLLVVDIAALGVWRSYSAYVPTAVPRALVSGKAAIVNLPGNVMDWYLPIEVSRAAEGNWDEPPQFPGLTNAYYQVLEAVMDLVKKPFRP